MGLLNKSPAEKKLKEITGGFILKNEFIKHLESLGLEINDGTIIRSQIKKEIKQGTVTEDNVE
ncbi:hypothetical protein [Methanobrevibacter sp.]|uniref:hypothetical protein n=1 Tax=Methanobrevibacter sp. TaxID=66852 RepID=UPI00388ED01F